MVGLLPDSGSCMCQYGSISGSMRTARSDWIGPIEKRGVRQTGPGSCSAELVGGLVLVPSSVEFVAPWGFSCLRSSARDFPPQLVEPLVGNRIRRLQLLRVERNPQLLDAPAEILQARVALAGFPEPDRPILIAFPD